MRLGKPNNTGTPVHDDLCDIAAGYVRETGCFSVVVMHSKEPHMLILWPEDLEKLAELARANRAKMADERAA
jgi:hypothetical protein